MSRTDTCQWITYDSTDIDCEKWANESRVVEAKIVVSFEEDGVGGTGSVQDQDFGALEMPYFVIYVVFTQMHSLCENSSNHTPLGSVHISVCKNL